MPAIDWYCMRLMPAILRMLLRHYSRLFDTVRRRDRGSRSQYRDGLPRYREPGSAQPSAALPQPATPPVYAAISISDAGHRHEQFSRTIRFS